MNMVFRDHSLSDLIGFVYSGVPAKEAADDFIHRVKQAAEPVLAEGQDGGGADHFGWRERLGVLSAVRTRIPAAALRWHSKRSVD